VITSPFPAFPERYKSTHSRLLTLENAAYVEADHTKRGAQAGAVAHQTASGGEARADEVIE
jgi:hypothetical protein